MLQSVGVLVLNESLGNVKMFACFLVVAGFICNSKLILVCTMQYGKRICNIFVQSRWEKRETDLELAQLKQNMPGLTKKCEFIVAVIICV